MLINFIFKSVEVLFMHFKTSMGKKNNMKDNFAEQETFKVKIYLLQNLYFTFKRLTK